MIKYNFNKSCLKTMVGPRWKLRYMTLASKTLCWIRHYLKINTTNRSVKIFFDKSTRSTLYLHNTNAHLDREELQYFIRGLSDQKQEKKEIERERCRAWWVLPCRYENIIEELLSWVCGMSRRHRMVYYTIQTETSETGMLR